MCLLHVHNALMEIKNLRKKKDKEYALKKHLDAIGRPFYMAIKFALEPTMKFNIKAISYKPSIKATNDSTILFDYLEELSKKNGATNADKERLSILASFDKETVEVVNMILSKNLNCGFRSEIARLVVPDLTDPAVMLCSYKVEVIKSINHVSPSLKMFVRKCGGWPHIIGHLKLDGMRIKYSGGEYFTRNGLPSKFFSFLDYDVQEFCCKIRKELNYTNEEFPIELDGEIMYSGELNSTSTNYASIKNIDKSKLTYNIFDIPNIRHKQKERIELIERVGETGQVIPVKTYSFESEQDFLDMFDAVIEDGYEGFVLKNTNAKYVGKKSPDWCKVKLFETIDLPVYSVLEGTGKFYGKVGTFVCLFNGKKVNVAKGACTDEEADAFLKNPPKMIEVKYQEITPDGAFRFPTYLRDRTGDKG